VSISILVYSIVFSHFTCLKHYVFSSYAGDLGIFNQAFYTTVFHGKLFYYTVENYVNPTGSYFAIHFSPILFILVPFYAICPRPETLLILQSCILSLGALPLYLIVKKMIGDNKLALFASLSYLLYPALQGANWFDFHPQAFYPLLIFSTYYFFIEERWKLFMTFTALTLIVMEWSAFMVTVFSINLLLMEVLSHSALLKIKQRSILKSLVAKKNIVLVSTVVLSIIWWFFVEYVQNTFFPLDPTFRPLIRATANWKVLYGTDSEDLQPLLSMPVYVLLHPQRALNALLYDYHVKFLYFILLFAPLLFLPLRSSLFLSPIALLIPFLLSNLRGYYMIGNQYPLHVLPFIFLAFVDGLKKVSNGKRVGGLIVIVSLLFIISTSPISPLSQAFANEVRLFGYPPCSLTVDENVIVIHRLIDLIPSNASVLATNSLFPHVSSRLSAYAIPAWWWELCPDEFSMYLSSLINKSDYILLRVSECVRGHGSYVLNKVSRDQSFGLYAVGAEVLLFKRGYSGKVLNLDSYPKAFLAYQDMHLGRNAIRIEYPEPVVFYPKVAGKGVVVYGPYAVLPPGAYRVTFILRTGEATEGCVAKLDVANDYGREILAKGYVYGFMLEPQKWVNATLTFHSDKLLISAEFRIFAYGLADLYVSKIIVERLQPTHVFSTAFNYEDLLCKNAVLDRGLLLHPRSFVDDVFWYGPYVALPPGRYEVKLYLKIVPPPKEGESVLTIDVVSGFRGTSGVVLAKIDVDTARTKSIGLDWYELKVAFNTTTELRDVEFRGLRPSPYYDIYLAYILVEKTESQ
jgi:uncharacterized membrane protein